MDIYLTADGQRLRIPLLPNRISVKTGAMSVGFQIIKGGEYKIPRGTALTGYSWSGVFPGTNMANASFVHDWQAPNRIIATLRKWENEGKIIKLMVTETTINDDVFIESFVFEHYGYDDVSYTITLTAYRPLYVTTAPPQPEVIIPEQEEEKPETKPTTQANNNSNKNNTTKAPQTNTTNDTKKKKLTVKKPGSKGTAVAKSAVKRSTVTVTSSTSTAAKKNIWAGLEMVK